MLPARRFLLVPALLVLLAPRAAAAGEPEPRPSRPPIVLPDEGPPPWGAPGVVYLHVETLAVGLELHVFDGIMPSYNAGPRSRGRIVSRRVCVAPCDRIVDAREGALYFFTAPGQMLSERFRLNERSGPVTARVDVASLRVRDAGQVMGILGMFLGIGGGDSLGYGFAMGRFDPAASRTPKIVGASLLSGSVVALVTAAVLLTRKTTVRFSLPAPP